MRTDGGRHRSGPFGDSPYSVSPTSWTVAFEAVRGESGDDAEVALSALAICVDP